MPSKARVMVVALDAADPTLVREFAGAGDMPTMSRLLGEAAAVETLAPPGVFVSANWPTIFTATSPDRHGYLCWDEIRGGTYEYRLTGPAKARGTPIWERLSEAGRRVAVLDVPHTVVRPVNGVILAEWGCHDRHQGTASWPAELAGELSARHGEHFGTVEPPGFDQFAPCDYTHRAGPERTDEETVALFETICDGVERKRLASLDLLDRGGWDLFFNVMGESHCVGHQLWHLHDASHPAHDPALGRRAGGDPVREVYRRLDAVVADHLQRLSPQDTAYVVLAHGMTAHHDGTHLLDYVLHRLDIWLDDPNAYGPPTRAAAELARWVPRPVRGRALRLAAPLVRARSNAAPPPPPPPLAERRWFLTPNNTVVGAVRLNLDGREPCGRIHPADRRKVLRWLGGRLTELVNVDTGGRVVRRCWIADDVYRRTPDDAFGDLFVEWERSAPIERVWSPATGTVAVPYEHWRQGDHVREGLTFAIGPGIRAGRQRGVFDTADLGATFAAALGVSLPDADGQPVASILPDGVGAPPPARRPLSRGRALLGRALGRRAQRRVPGWARRQDNHALNRLRHDFSERADRADEEAAKLKKRVGQLERHSEIAAMSAWLPHAEVPEELLVSVVMPTRDRRDLLAEAIASVQAQSYSRWELLVVDDGSTDDTARFLRGVEDPRVRPLGAQGAGACAARNLALDAVRGDVIAYLDDDNTFDPEWLKAIALTFVAYPDKRICYGARVIDDMGRALRTGSNGRAAFQYVGWDPETIRDYNFVDMNVLAHRPTDVRFDESLTHLGDWDFVLRLAQGAEPLEVPAIAAYYRTDVWGRLSTSLPLEQMDRERDYVRNKVAAETGAEIERK